MKKKKILLIGLIVSSLLIACGNEQGKKNGNFSIYDLIDGTNSSEGNTEKQSDENVENSGNNTDVSDEEEQEEVKENDAPQQPVPEDVKAADAEIEELDKYAFSGLEWYIPSSEGLRKSSKEIKLKAYIDFLVTNMPESKVTEDDPRAYNERLDYGCNVYSISLADLFMYIRYMFDDTDFEAYKDSDLKLLEDDSCTLTEGFRYFESGRVYRSFGAVGNGEYMGDDILTDQTILPDGAVLKKYTYMDGSRTDGYFYILGKMRSIEGKRIWQLLWWGDSLDSFQYKAGGTEVIDPSTLFEEETPHLDADITEAYDRFLAGYEPEYGDPNPHYGYAYIDEDDIPELIIIDNDAHANSPRVYTFYNGSVSYVGCYGSTGELEYVEKGNYIISTYSGMGYNYYAAVKIVDGSGKELINMCWNMESEWEAYGKECLINNQPVSEEELKRAFSEYFEGRQTKTIRYSECPRIP